MQKIKHLINILGAGTLAWSIWITFQLWIFPPLENTKAASIQVLKNRILEIGMERFIWAIGMIIILIAITWGIQYFIEKKRNRKELLFLFGIDLLIIAVGLMVGAFDALNGLTIEIERYF